MSEGGRKKRRKEGRRDTLIMSWIGYEERGPRGMGGSEGEREGRGGGR